MTDQREDDQKTVNDKDGNPKIRRDTIGMIPITFDTKEFAELFTRQCAGRETEFLNIFDNF